MNAAAAFGPYLMAECDLNDIQVVTPRTCGGQGFHAQWNDDFHHALHALLTGERAGYYEDFGSIAHLAKTAGEGYVYTGQFSKYRRKKHGSPSKHMSCRQFIVFSQNHDQTGNRALGERLANLVPHDKLRLAATMVLLSPSIPLLFMGEEYGETAPFLYFISHGDEELVEAIRAGRAEEFASFHGRFTVPDPHSLETFKKSRVNRDLRLIRPHSSLYAFYRHLLDLRRSIMPWDLKENWPHVQSWPEKNALSIILHSSAGDTACLYNFGTEFISVSPGLPDGALVKVSDTSSPRWGGDGEIAPLRIHTEDAGIPLGPINAVIYRKET
jgi:maltooligosyltrehalose trehalohydrolase